MTQPTLESLSKQLTKLSNSVASQTREINDIYAQIAKLAIVLPEKCPWCRGEHTQEKCPHDDFMEDLKASKSDVDGVFEAEGRDRTWIFAFPINKYPILVGYCTTKKGPVFSILNFFSGRCYGEDGLPETEIFSKHEFQVIKDNDPDLAEWIEKQGIRATN